MVMRKHVSSNSVKLTLQFCTNLQISKIKIIKIELHLTSYKEFNSD